ncbi:MAG: hydrogenase maturation peptidase HycI [Anaerolineaceae bacterium]|nr:hydrogenase maturation peptidase HycI [Anaerolineaceae bacterium]
MKNIWQENLENLLTSLSQNDSPRTAIVGIGNEIRSDDAVGVYIVRSIRNYISESEKVLLVEAGPSPESFTGMIKAHAPQVIIFIDAAEMGEKPGTVRLLTMQEIDGFSASTHTLPLSIIGKYLALEIGCPILTIAIQPETLEFDEPISASIQSLIEPLAKEIASFLV